MAASEHELVEAERTYRKLRFTMICHLAFFVLCCVAVAVLRRSMGLPPALLGMVIIVFLIAFAGDIWRFLTCRERIRRLRASHPRD